MLMDAGIPTPVKLIFSAVFLYIFFAFLNSRYWISAMGITAAVVLCLSVYHGNPLDILSSRLLYTLLGCVMGLLATFLFPIWQSGRLKELFFKVLVANREYLYQVSISNNEKDRHQVRLARKRSYQSLSVLSEGMELSASEPKWQRRELLVARQVQLLCFQCNGLIASIGSEGRNNGSINNTYYLEEMDRCIAQFMKSNLVDWKNVSSKTTSLLQPMELGVVLNRLQGCFKI
jgi:hypothetical protein